MMLMDIPLRNLDNRTAAGWSAFKAQQAEPMRQRNDKRAQETYSAEDYQRAIEADNAPMRMPPGHSAMVQTQGTAAVSASQNSHEGAAEHGVGHGPGAINWFTFGDSTKGVPYAAYLINFAILIAILVKMGKKPVSEALVARRDKVAKDIEEATRMKAEATVRAATYKAQLDSLASDAEAAKQTMLHAAASDKSRVVAEAEAAAVRMTKDAEFSVEQQRKTLAQALHAELTQSITAGALALLHSNVGPADHERLAEAFLTDLERGHLAKGAA